MTKIDQTFSKVIWFYAIAVLLGFAMLLYYYIQNGSESKGYTVRAIQTAKGYGYEVCLDGQVFIHQECIPGNMDSNAFATPQSALLTGGLVADKLNKGQVPTVTGVELDSLGVVAETKQ